ncbi:hypothetical protein [Natronococcus sp. A-GB7]|uniref:hypothetical protein n=1 Tax=Natronococcus sp. A-GB7 TaxID=3037649 RepID=UPI00241EC8FE|nr:hypothetical protein [Natronococcus sp. A-GB7]MDG5819727.1 hypothetical protein [Natronococcus sp. A-GB7]
MTVEVGPSQYEALDWSTVEHNWAAWHLHRRGTDGWHEIVDALVSQGYSIISIGEKQGSQPWPWTDWDDVEDDEYDHESRDPEEEGVIGLPGLEWNDSEHVVWIGSTLYQDEIDEPIYRFRDAVREVRTREDHHFPRSRNGVTFLAHIGRYSDDPDEWERWEAVHNLWSPERHGFLGVAFGGRNQTVVDVWDRLLEEIVPNHPVYGFYEMDNSDSEVGEDFDVRLTTVLTESSLDPTDQTDGRERVIDRLRSGQFLAHFRGEWDPDEEDRPRLPRVTEIAVSDDRRTISIEAEAYDEITWISRGEEVETGSSIDVDEEMVPYVRAELSGVDHDDTVTFVQPFYVRTETTVASFGGE